MAKVALVEFNPYHDECLYSQMKFLGESGHSVLLVVSQQIHERGGKLIPMAEHTVIFRQSSQKNLFTRMAFIFGLNRLLARHKVEALVFNTASSRGEVILLGHLMKGRTKLFGILHNLKKVNHSFSQKLINRAIKKFFVLNDFLSDAVPLDDPSIRLKSFYPIFFPEFQNTVPPKPKEEVWISIPGKLDFGRRDYYLVARALVQTRAKSNIKILVLGSASLEDPKIKEFLEFIKIHGLQDHFVTFDAFLEEGAFHGFLKKTDHILIPMESVGDDYAKYKIMGCYNQAFGHKIGLITPVGLGHIPDLKAHSILYQGVDGLSKVLENLNDRKIDKKNYASKKWDFEEQRNNYISFLEIT